MRPRLVSTLVLLTAWSLPLSPATAAELPHALDVDGAVGYPPAGVIVAWAILIGAGLVLATATLIGLRRAHRRAWRASLPIIDLNRHTTRRALISIVTVLVVCTVIVGASMVKVVEYTESNAFCGETCHAVMAPEYTAFQRSAHSGVHCVDCHVGPGVGGFIRAKINGSVQLAEVILGNYGAPISTPVHNLPDPRGTCMSCHTAEAYHGVKPKIITRFAEDESNTETNTVLLLDVGGDQLGEFEGIHRHVDPQVTIRYRSDAARRDIREVEMTLADGTVSTYTSNRVEDDDTHTEWRTMDCIDCHNRPSHNYAEAAEAVDLMLERGFIARDLPFIKREGLRAVQVDYASHEAAQAGIATDIERFYRENHADLAEARVDDIAHAGHVLGSVYTANVFPAMQIDWGTYPDHSGHEASAGCFRCHGGDHATKTGETISADCRICHAILAWDEASPEILQLIEASERGGVSSTPSSVPR